MGTRDASSSVDAATIPGAMEIVKLASSAGISTHWPVWSYFQPW
jgi:hypothetical protein